MQTLWQELRFAVRLLKKEPRLHRGGCAYLRHGYQRERCSF
jgi:hypothetical protein